MPSMIDWLVEYLPMLYAPICCFLGFCLSFIMLWSIYVHMKGVQNEKA